jgi:Flp pilus assembly protein TadG
MDASETDLDVADRAKFSVGDIVEFQDDGEQCLVTVTGTGAGALTVIRGVNGTTAATHSSGTLIAQNPVFSFFQMENAVTECIQELWPNVYKSVAYSITPVAGTRWYELDSGGDTATLLDLSVVRQVIPRGAVNEPFDYGTRHSAYPATLYTNVPVSIAASSRALYVPRLRDTTNPILVTGLTQVTDTVSGSDYSDLTAGVQVQCVTAYAVAKLISWTGVSRVTQEDIGMSDESVRPGTRESIAQEWERRGYMARRRWEQELAATYPRKPSQASARRWDGA